jgi:hypothetical protein
MIRKRKATITTTPPLTEQLLHEKGEIGVFLLKKEKGGSTPGTDMKDLVPTS